MADVLRAIASSATDVDQVLTAICETAARLCQARNGVLLQIRARDGQLAPRALFGPVPLVLEDDGAPVSGPPDFESALGSIVAPTSMPGRAFLEGRVIHVHDLASVVESEYPDSKELQARVGIRTVVFVPLLRNGNAIGVLSMQRFEVRPFTDQQIALVESFADQAVIAIENARLFEELEQRNSARALSRGAGAADRHRRGPAGHRLLAERTRACPRRRGREAPGVSAAAAGAAFWALEGDSLVSAGRRRPATARSPRQRCGCRSIAAWCSGARSSIGGRSTSTTCGRASRASTRPPPGSRALGSAPCSASRSFTGARAIGGLAVSAPRSPTLHRPPDRAAGDVRRPGRDRDRERPPVRGAGAAQRRASGEQPPGHRGAGAADRDGRGAAGHRLLADRSADGAGRDCRERRTALRCCTGRPCSSPSTAIDLGGIATAVRSRPRSGASGGHRVRRPALERTHRRLAPFSDAPDDPRPGHGTSP